MIDVDLLSVIRRWHAREHLSIREIAKRTGLIPYHDQEVPGQR